MENKRGYIKNKEETLIFLGNENLAHLFIRKMV